MNDVSKDGGVDVATLTMLITNAAAAGPAPSAATSAATPAATPAAPTWVPDRLQVLIVKANYWALALSSEHDRLHFWQRGFGYPVVLISAATGIGAFTQLDGNPAWWATLTVAIVAFLSAGLAAVQTRADFEARAKDAAASSAKFGDLYGRMLGVADDIRHGTAGATDQVAGLIAEYATLKEARPPVPDRIRTRASQTMAADTAALAAYVASHEHAST